MNGQSMLRTLACVCGLWLLVGSVAAQTVSISPNPVNSPAKGRTFTIDLKISNGKNVAGYQATLNFDSAALKYVSSSGGTYLSNAFVVPAIKRTASVTLAAQAFSASNGNGTLARVTFEVVAVKASTLRLSGVTVVDPDGKAASLVVVNGRVVPSRGRSPDVNGDGIVNISDLALVASRFGSRVAGVWDVNGDGVVNILDLGLVANAFGTSGVAAGASEASQPPAVVDPSPPPASPPAGMVLIPAGEFAMGSEDGDAENDEQPVHTVYVDVFYMDTHEVTNLDYKKFVLANPRWQKDRIPRALHNGNYLHHWSGNNYPTGKANHPVVYVSWYAAMAYAEWAGKRLPSEAEWERAARGGLAGRKYPWGNTISSARANYGNLVKDTTPVGKYAANGYGLYDMAGNAWEWCLDAYDANFYFTSPKRNPLSDVNTMANIDLILKDYTGVKSSRVLRGGSWLFAARYVRVASRFRYSPTNTDIYDGFRCARALK